MAVARLRVQPALRPRVYLALDIALVLAARQVAEGRIGSLVCGCYKYLAQDGERRGSGYTHSWSCLGARGIFGAFSVFEGPARMVSLK